MIGLRELAAQATPGKTCPHCGAVIVGKKPQAVFCSRKCKEASRYKRSSDYREKHDKRSAEYRASEKGKANTRERGTRAYHKHPERGRARAAVQAAVRSGRLVKPEACENCRTIAELEGHHHRGYEGDARLDVVWLCIPCHVEADRKEA